MLCSKICLGSRCRQRESGWALSLLALVTSLPWPLEAVLAEVSCCAFSHDLVKAETAANVTWSGFHGSGIASGAPAPLLVQLLLGEARPAPLPPPVLCVHFNNAEVLFIVTWSGLSKLFSIEKVNE